MEKKKLNADLGLEEDPQAHLDDYKTVVQNVKKKRAAEERTARFAKLQRR